MSSDAPAGWPEQHPPGDWSAPGWAPPRHNGPAIASLFLGLASLPAVLFLVPGVILGIMALALGLIGRGRVKRGEADAKGVATAGTVLGSAAIAGAVLLGVTIYLVDENNQNNYEKCVLSGRPGPVCVEEFDPPRP